MQISTSLKLLTLSTLSALAVSLIPPISNAAPKVGQGATCKSLNKKTTVQNKTFTCIKKNGKLVWSKGVIKTETQQAAPTESSLPKPTPTAPAKPQIKLPADGTLCPKVGEKIIVGDRFARCSWGGHSNSQQEAINNLRWRLGTLNKVSTTQSNNYAKTPSENATCTNSGDTWDVSGGILECRWVAGLKLQWIKVNNTKNSFTNAKSPVPIETCKLQNSASKVALTGRDSGQVVGFPFDNSGRNRMNVKGVNEVLIVPIDFSDFPGGPGVIQQLNYDKKWLEDWYNYFSNGQTKFNVTTIDRWFRMPKSLKAYPTDGKTGNALTNGNQVMGNQAQAFISEIAKEVDLRKFNTVYTFYPDGEYYHNDLIVRNHMFKIPEGEVLLNFFSWGRNLEGMETLKWSYYIHETLHDFYLPGHAPGNGWPLGMMTNQSGISLVMNHYERFLLDWIPAEQIYCEDVASLKTTRVSLSPVEREDRQTKMALIKLSPTKLIVVESHGIDKWSSFKFGDREFPPGFYSVMTYVVDLEKSGAPPVRSDGSSLSNDEWAWAVWQKVQGERSNQFNLSVGENKNLADYVAVLGDSFVIEGVKIKFVATGDYETIEISKA